MFHPVSLIANLLLFTVSCDSYIEKPVSSQSKTLTCSGQKDKVVTTDYLGAREEVIIDSNPENVGHASAVELVWSSMSYPANEQFAAAWISSSNKPWVRRYSTNQYVKDFIGNVVQLDTWSTPGWIRTLGFDDDCSSEISGADTCAWFTWEDIGGYINWRAIGNNGNLSGLSFFNGGHQPSGDTGQVYVGWQLTRKKLLAWISSDRTAVHAQLLNNNGSPIPGTLVTLKTTSGDWRAYQTAVAWSYNEEKWLVAWTEAKYDVPLKEKKNAIIFTRLVEFNGGMGPNINGISYCEGQWNDPNCSTTSLTPFPGSSRANDYCVCKGLWLSTSYYSSSTNDRYRLHQYTKHVRLNIYGQRNSIQQGFCNTYCPITESAYTYGKDQTPFQCLDLGPSNTVEKHHLAMDSFNFYVDSEVFSSPFRVGQAFRSNGLVAAALGTDPTGSALKLSIVDVHPYGCPP